MHLQALSLALFSEHQIVENVINNNYNCGDVIMLIVFYDNELTN